MQISQLAGFLADVLLVALSFFLCMWLKPGVNTSYLSDYFPSFLLFLLIWTWISYYLKKYRFSDYAEWKDVVRTVLLSNSIIFLLITGIMYLVQVFHYSRFIVLGTVGVSTVAEMITGAIVFMVRETGVKHENGVIRGLLNGISMAQKQKVRIAHLKRLPGKDNLEARIDYLKNEIGEEAFNFVEHYAAIDSPDTLIISTVTRFTIDAQVQPQFECILNVNRVNDIRYINKFFEAVNTRLPVGGIFIDFVETKNMRKKRILNKYPFGINYIYYALDFIVKRVLPKFNLTKKIYFLLTRGENRVLSQAETYGRLYSCGFEILDEKIIGSNLYFIAIKVKQPAYPENPTYGPLVVLERIGKEGKPIKVFKMRTMHPYAEYLQDYVYKKDGLQDGGKFKDDFRVTTLGKIMRSFWIDELPMVINLIKGDLKLFGVRPLSKQYFKLYSTELQELRNKYKPGLIPPFYVDYPKTLDEIIESELRYLKAYERHPFQTDWIYFWKALFNIMFKRYRSK